MKIMKICNAILTLFASQLALPIHADIVQMKRFDWCRRCRLVIYSTILIKVEICNRHEFICAYRFCQTDTIWDIQFNGLNYWKENIWNSIEIIWTLHKLNGFLLIIIRLLTFWRCFCLVDLWLLVLDTPHLTSLPIVHKPVSAVQPK